MTPAYLNEVRAYLKQYTITPTHEAFTEHADQLTSLLPILIESITDAELTDISNSMWDYVMQGILTAQTPSEPTESFTEGQLMPSPGPTDSLGQVRQSPPSISSIKESE